MKGWIMVAAAAFVAVGAAPGVPPASAGRDKVAVVELPRGKATTPPLEEGRSYFFAYEFSGDVRRLHTDTPGWVEGEYLGEQRGNWVKVRQTRADRPGEKPTVFWINLDRVAVIKAWPLVGE